MTVLLHIFRFPVATLILVLLSPACTQRGELPREQLVVAKAPSGGGAEAAQQESEHLGLIDLDKLDVAAFYRDFREFQIFDPGTKQTAADFSGTYSVIYGPEEISFRVQLKQTGSTIRGSYCGYSPTRVDCGQIAGRDTNCPIKGKVYGDTCYLTYISCYQGAKGMAKLHKNGYDIVWQAFGEMPARDVNFVAAPYQAVLINESARSNNLTGFSKATGTFHLTTTLHQGKTSVFNDCQLYQSERLVKPIFNLKLGDTLLVEGPSIKYVEATENGVHLNVPVYLVKYQGVTAYVKGVDLPLQRFTDGAGHLLMIGMDGPTQALQLKVRHPDGTIDGQTLYPEAYTMSVYGDRYVEYYFTFAYRSDLSANNFEFFEFRYEHRGSGGFAGNRMYYWNGSSMLPLWVEEMISGIAVGEELYWKHSRESGGDTLVYRIETAENFDESGEYELLETVDYWFLPQGDKLQLVDR